MRYNFRNPINLVTGLPNPWMSKAPARLVLQYRSAPDADSPAAWLSGRRQFALDRLPLAEVAVSPTGIEFYDERNAASGEQLLLAFGLPGERALWRSVARVEFVSGWTHPTRPQQKLYRLSTNFVGFAPGGQEAYTGFLTRLTSR